MASRNPIKTNYCWSDSPTHCLSKFLDIILRPLTEKVKGYVHDDIEFLSHLPKKSDFGSTFVTLDVTSLYTNISRERGIEAISYWIEAYPNYLADDRFTKDFITDGLLLVLKNNYFQFNNTMWHQLIGTAMGTNVAVIYAIFYGLFGTRALPKCQKHVSTRLFPIYHQYMEAIYR